MKVSCPSCQTNYNIDDKRIPPGGAKLKCANCQTTFPIQAGGASAAVPLPGNAGAPGAIPLPGGAAPRAAGGGAVPLPGNAAPKAAAPAGAVPLPGNAARAPAPGAVPLPGNAARAPAPGAVPLPGNAARAPAPGAVPLPGNAAATPFPDPAAAYNDMFNMPTPFPTMPGDQYPPAGAGGSDQFGSWDDSTSVATNPGGSPAVPLPGAAGGYDSGEEDFSQDESTRIAPMPVPPAAYGEAPGDDFGDFGAPPHGGAVPLPGAHGAAPELPPEPTTRSNPNNPYDEFNKPTRPRSAVMDIDGSAVPLPGSGQNTAPYEADFSDYGSAPPAAPAGYDAPADGGEMDFSDLSSRPPAPPPARGRAIAPPPPAADSSLDFDDLPPAPSAIAPPPPQDLSFDFAPPPPRVAASGPAIAPPPPDDLSFDFASPPPGARPPPPDIGIDFGGDDMPPPPSAAPPADPLMDFGGGMPPPPGANAGAPSFDFDDADPSMPPPPRGPGADPLEFDPTAPPPGSLPSDDLEADLSAPIPTPASAPAGNSDGLEMLSFIDDAGKSAGASKSKVKRFHVRRRSGKVFGPFEEGVVVKMLEDGQLLGNEDVSPDGESWSGMSTVPLFAQTIQKLMESPSSGGNAAPTIPPPMMGETSGPAASGPQNAAATMDRLKQLYEGRMAAVSVVDRPDPFAAVKKRLPLVIAAGVALLVVGIGFSFGFTRYGAFGMKKLLPAKLSQGDTGYAELQNAKKALSADTFKSYKEARDLTAKVLAGKEYPEARAVWAQAIFYLQRRYAAATPAEVAQANASLEHVEMLGAKHVEVAKAFAGAALAKKQPDQALAPLKEAKSRAENDKDPELDLLLAEALEQKRDAKGAKDALAKVITRDPKSAKAQHALGNLHQAASDADNAVKAYQAALDADPDHVISAVELAAVELLIGKDVEGGIKALEKATGEKVKSLLGPAELARARSLMGVALAEQFKPKEAIVAFDEAIKLDANSAFTKAMMGRVLLAQRDYEKALPLLKEAQERDPNKLDYTDGYISALLALGKLSDAVKAVDEANRRFPSNARIAYLQGRVHEGSDKQAEAETSYKRALASDPKLYEANLALARLYLSLKRVVDARAQMEPAYARAPNDALVRTGMGELYLAEKDFAKAEDEFKKAAELNPTLAETHLGLSRVLLSRNELDAALAEVDRAIELDKNVKDGRLQRGVVLWKKGDLDNALKELEAAKAVDPKNARIAVVMGAVQFDRGNLPDAEKNLLTAISSDSTNAEPHFYLAQVRAKRLEYTQAIDNMKNALERAPKRPDYHYQMGIIYRDAKRLPEAIDSWKVVLKLDPNHADAHEAMGQAYLERSRLDDAIASFDLALKADPKRTRIEAFVADCYFQAAKWNDAIARYKDALKDDASLVHVYYKIGRAYSEQGKHKDAVSWYQKATDVEKSNPMPFYYLGYLYKEKGKRREAVAAFKAYLERKPNAEDKREIEDEIFDLSQ